MAKTLPLATLEIAVPPGHAGQTVIATLKSSGRIVAQGRSKVSAGDEARVILRASELAARRGSEDYELWATLDADGGGSWYPGFGDFYIHDTWHFRHGPWKRVADPSAWRERRLSGPDNLLRIHYHRFGGYYEGVGLWTWNDHSSLPPVEIFEVGRDDFGLVFELDKAEYGGPADQLRLGLLPRIGGDWHLKEDDNKFWDASLGDEIYLIGTIPHIWRERPDTRQQVLASFIDAPRCVAVELSRPVDPGEINPGAVHLEDGRGRRIKISHIVQEDKPSSAVKVKTAEPLDVGRHAYTVGLEHFSGRVPASLRDILDDPQWFYEDALALGACYTPYSTVFRLFAPTAVAGHVVLRDEPAENHPSSQSHAMQKIGKGIFEAVLPGDWRGKFYRYRLEGPGFSPEREILDPYAVSAIGHHARVTDLPATNPPGWESHRAGPGLESPVDMVVYEMHVRDFTIADNSGVSGKGKYRGFAEGGTRLPGNPGIATALDHLQELGVTHVQLLPVQSFNRGGEGAYNWGYMTAAFNSPEGWYATRQDDDSRIREFKELVAALHARNIGVILDVVYNHTDHSAPFSLINAKYYFRFFANNTYANGSGVGNDFRSEAPMARKFIIDSLKYWVAEYGVDGFRFDLMALLDIETMREAGRELRKIKPDIALYGEPWSCGFSPMKGQPSDKTAIRGTGIGAFNDHFRNALGGSPDGSESGFLQNGSRRDQVILGLEGSCRDWADSPAQAVNYMTCHDNLVLYDKLRWFNPAASEEDILDAIKLGYLLLFTAQGVPFLHGGEEFARTKYGHGNSYNAGDEINQVDWALKAENYRLFCYTRDLIRLRKTHPLFRLRTAEAVYERVRFHPAPTEKCLVYGIDGRGLEGEGWQEACVLANGEEGADVEFMLPPGLWRVAFDCAGLADDSGLVGRCVNVRRKSGLILYKTPQTLAGAQDDMEFETGLMSASDAEDKPGGEVQ